MWTDMQRLVVLLTHYQQARVLHLVQGRKKYSLAEGERLTAGRRTAEKKYYHVSS